MNRSLSPESPDRTLRLGDHDNDITVHLNLDAALDIRPDLQRLVRLNRLGYFNEAISLFEERLAPHIDFFPVASEYADLLLEQGSFGDLHEFVSSRLKDSLVQYSRDEMQLWKLLKSLAELYTKGALIPALESTMEMLRYLETKSDDDPLWYKHSTGLQIQTVEICLRIIAYAGAHSCFLWKKSFKPLAMWGFDKDKFIFPQSESCGPLPLSFEAHGIYSGAYPPLGDWYRFVVQNGFYWDSHRLLRSILPFFADEEGHYLDNGHFEHFAQLDTLSGVRDMFSGAQASLDDEQLALTHLANASLLASFFDVPTGRSACIGIQRQLTKEAHSLALSILSRHPPLVNSRPYLNWLLLETTKGLCKGNYLQPTSNQFRRVARIQSRETTKDSVNGSTDTKSFLNAAMENTLEIVALTAKGLGDYHLQQSVLWTLLRESGDFSKMLQRLIDLSVLCQRSMQDTAGFLNCLIDEYLLLEFSNTASVDDKRRDLYRQLCDFSNDFPSRFDYDLEERRRLNITFFDIPLLSWMRIKVSAQLLKDMGRDRQAELLEVKLRRIEEHIPRTSMRSNPEIFVQCLDCEYCGDSEMERISVNRSGPQLDSFDRLTRLRHSESRRRPRGHCNHMENAATILSDSSYRDGNPLGEPRNKGKDHTSSFENFPSDSPTERTPFATYFESEESDFSEGGMSARSRNFERSFRKLAVLEWKHMRERVQQRQKEETAKLDKEFRERLRAELGCSEEEIEAIIKKTVKSETEEGKKPEEEQDHPDETKKPTWIKVHRKYLLPETLMVYHLPWDWDEDDSNYIIIKKWVTEELQEELFSHTRRLREDKVTAQTSSSATELKVNDRNKDKINLVRKRSPIGQEYSLKPSLGFKEYTDPDG
ncbi:hypothetical protein Asppvi_003676 [Aspergillus pseudoviridinutans]|uniref:Uncharacterized protein n=1 Tax=Aspergillus pseudoviridinutans TaxID=1517512 RepID=A0A9P3B8S6_9EURO|nr:uncharacterized protein Asppvi_003676 [Aspergillus pseudoviridinutans]GIJ84825.1 hypothetical protein Asppvi_003676 [Aspergillus pseudoviridinutans]